jgi:hypothetical protein
VENVPRTVRVHSTLKNIFHTVFDAFALVRLELFVINTSDSKRVVFVLSTETMWLRHCGKALATGSRHVRCSFPDDGFLACFMLLCFLGA